MGTIIATATILATSKIIIAAVERRTETTVLWAYVSELNKEIRTERFRVMESLMMVLLVLLKDGFLKKANM